MVRGKGPDNKHSDPVQALLGPGGLLGRSLPFFEVRPSQLAMARLVGRALQEGTRLVVEAGTGTGKTLAYLVPAVLSGLKVVISTGTKTLQEQLVGKDIPLLLDRLDLDLQVACMKGLSNYLCLRRLQELRRRGSDLLWPDPLLDKLVRWAARTDSGDRAGMTELPDGAELWAEVCASTETRLGSRCAHYEDCFVTIMRRRAAAARLVVVNHHLLLADLVLRSTFPEAAVIPPCEALILDEAHQLEGVATTFFGRTIAARMMNALARDARRGADSDDARATEKLAGKLEQTSAELFFLLRRDLELVAPLDQPRLPGNGRSIPPGAVAGRQRLLDPPLTGEREQPYFALDAALEALSEHLARHEADRPDAPSLVQRCQKLREDLALFAERPSPGTVLWAERARTGEVTLHGSPVEVGPLLQQTLLAGEVPLVFTSATLAVSSAAEVPLQEGSCDPALGFFCERVGLCGEQAERTAGLVLPSPFSHEEQVLLYVPRDLPLPGSAGFILQATERIARLLVLSGGRALVLFTSHAHLESAWRLLSGQLPFSLLCQGERPRSVLLRRFREEVQSVLLATASFWEGVDVPGESLSLVVMDKLPFAVPDDPLVQARLERLREKGRDPFVCYQLPQAALALKQGFGRLIRHRNDRGVVAVLDRRLVERRYGRVLLHSLPPCPRTSDLAQVQRYFEQLES